MSAGRGPQPIIVSAGSNDYSAICDECVSAKNRPGQIQDGWSQSEDLTDVAVQGAVDSGNGRWHIVRLRA